MFELNLDIAIVRPETLIRWHRAGFRAYWGWRSRNRVGRPKVSPELRTLIGEMSGGAPRIHGELLKLGFEVAQSTVARHMCRHRLRAGERFSAITSTASRRSTSLSCRRSHSKFCIVLSLCVRLWVSFGVTANPTAEWISRQVTEAFPWDHAPRYLIRDRDTSYGPAFVHARLAEQLQAPAQHHELTADLTDSRVSGRR
jgi:hypothetical protein